MDESLNEGNKPKRKNILIIFLILFSLLVGFFVYLSLTNKLPIELDNPFSKEKDGKEEVSTDIYTVSEGETLNSIASEYGITVETIKWANNLSSDSVRPGQELIIPSLDGVFITVKENDTLASIAKEYSGNEQDIADFNLLDYPFTLVVGQELFIPDGRMPQ